MRIRLLVADHHVAAVAGVRRFVADTEIEVIAQASDGKQAVELATGLEPNVVLMAVRLPEEDGLSALGRIKQARPDIPVVMTACHHNSGDLAQAHELGASGFLLKDFSPERLVATIRRVAAGERTWSREEVRCVTGVLTSDQLRADVNVPLTRREVEVLEAVTRGLTNRQIAEELAISYETIKEHVQHIIHKIGVNDRTQTAVWAVRNGLA